MLSGQRQAVRRRRRSTRSSPGCCRCSTRRCSRTWPSSSAARRPGGDPADGDPAGIVPGFQNYTGTVPADQLRLNVAIPPTTSNPNIVRPARRRRRRVPERPAGVRRRRQHRAAGDRRGHLPAGRQELHARRRGGRAHRGPDAPADRYSASSRTSASRSTGSTPASWANGLQRAKHDHATRALRRPAPTRSSWCSISAVVSAR